jgi:hypothetical protein
MTKTAKIAVVVLVIIIAAVVVGYLLAKYTTIGMSYRVDRLHKQIEARYDELNERYEPDEAKTTLLAELNDNRLLMSAAWDEDLLILCYVDGMCEDYLLGF